MSTASATTGSGLKRNASGFALAEEPRKQARLEDAPAKPGSSKGDASFGFRDIRQSKRPVATEARRYHPADPKSAPRMTSKRTPAAQRALRDSGRHLQPLAGPLHDEAHIRATYAGPTQPADDMLTKSNILKWVDKMDLELEFQQEAAEGTVDGSPVRVNRLTLTVDVSCMGLPLLVAVGDGRSAKEASNNAHASLAYQLHNNGLLYSAIAIGSNNVTLSNGQTIAYPMANDFVEFYCRHFKFKPPTVNLVPRKLLWDSIMEIEGRKVGLGTARGKKASNQRCVLDVVRYLEKCDPHLWNEYVEKARTGEGLGDAAPINFFLPRPIRQSVQDLCVDIHHSKLYAANAASALTAPTVVAPRRMRPYVNLQSKSEQLLTRRTAYLASPSMEVMRNTRATLPVNGRQEEVLEMVANNEVSIFMAATGSGKTTQIPQIILDSWIEGNKGAECNIICTQPRRLAAVGVATRVAAERGERLGESVGYAVRFDSKPPADNGSITFCTIGVFLKRLQNAFTDPEGPVSLDHLTHILVDEVHERDVDTDLLLVILKRFLDDRRARKVPLKIVLMSATIDATLFQNYFPNQNNLPAPVADIPGRSFPVEKMFLDDIMPKIGNSRDAWALKDASSMRFMANEASISSPAATPDEFDIPFFLIAATVSHILQTSTDEGHVLVFLPGLEEIVKIDRMLNELRWAADIRDRNKYETHILHSSIPLESQQAIFTRPRPGVRRIILSTNIAETSVTIPDVVHVVDSGRLKEQRFDPDRHLTSLVTAWVGRSNLNQRAGRAGRHRNGFYYGMLTQAHADQLSTYQTVEMARADLTNVVMHIKAMNFTNMTVPEVLAACIEPPSRARVDTALASLRAYGALEANEDLTALGRILLQLPIEVQLGRLLLYGSFFRCIDQAVTLAAIMSHRDPWLAPPDQRKQARAMKASWTPQHFSSDPLTTLRAFNEWNKMQASGRKLEAGSFASSNFISKSTFLAVLKTRAQLMQSLGQAGVFNIAVDDSGNYGANPEMNENANSYPALIALIAVASAPKFAVPIDAMHMRTRQEKKAVIHQSSVNSLIGLDKNVRKRLPANSLLTFMEKRQAGGGNTQTSLSMTTCLDPLTYILFGSQKQEVGSTAIRCDGWIVFNSPNEVMDLLRLRQYLDRAMMRLFAGLALSKRSTYSERETDPDGEEVKPLSLEERKELALLSRDVVSILDATAQERNNFFSRPREARAY